MISEEDRMILIELFDGIMNVIIQAQNNIIDDFPQNTYERIGEVLQRYGEHDLAKVWKYYDNWAVLCRIVKNEGYSAADFAKFCGYRMNDNKSDLHWLGKETSRIINHL